MMTYIGIDNGVHGAIAIIDAAVTVHKTPAIKPSKGKGKVQLDEAGMWELLRDVDPSEAFAATERVQARPKQGRSSAIATGRGDGLWRGMLVAAGIPYAVVGPRTWQGVLLRDVAKSDTKAASVIVAKRLFPGVSLLPTDKCRRADHNMADALLLAEYARRTHCNQ